MKYEGKLNLMDKDGSLIKVIPVSSDDGLRWRMQEALPPGDWWIEIAKALRELYPTLAGDLGKDFELNICHYFV